MTSKATAGAITSAEIFADIEKMRSQIGKIPRRGMILPRGVAHCLPAAVALRPFGRFPIYEHHMTKVQQHRKPRSKKRRIQKKAAKFRAGSPWWQEVPDDRCFMFDPGAFEVSDVWRVDGAMSLGGVA